MMKASSITTVYYLLSLACFRTASAQWTGASSHGQPLECAAGSVVTGACTSGRDKDCNNSGESHSLLCSATTMTPVFLASGTQGAWDATDVKNSNSREAWRFCAQTDTTQSAISARCAGGRDEDCGIGSSPNYDHGIRCTELTEDYYLRAGTEEWVCKDHGVRGECPSEYVAVASCASGENSDCEWNGCSGQETYTGLMCLQYGLLEKFEWYTNETEEKTFIVILEPTANPFLGCYDEETDSTTTRSGVIRKTESTSSEISASLETTITAKYGVVAFGGSIDAEVVATGSVSTSRSSGTFSEVEDSYTDSTSVSRTITFCSSEDFEDYVRLVSYRLTKEVVVKGTAFLIVAGQTIEDNVEVILTTTQEGFLPVRIASFPNLDVEALSDEDLVLKYLDGTLLGSSSSGDNPKTIAALEDFTHEVDASSPVDTASTSSSKLFTRLPPEWWLVGAVAAVLFQSLI